jgi:hypothetical protein
MNDNKAAMLLALDSLGSTPEEVIATLRAGEFYDDIWHPSEFRCETCPIARYLADLGFFGVRIGCREVIWMEGETVFRFVDLPEPVYEARWQIDSQCVLAAVERHADAYLSS